MSSPYWFVTTDDPVTLEEAGFSEVELVAGEILYVVCCDPENGDPVHETLIDVEPDHPDFQELLTGLPLNTSDQTLLQWLSDNPTPYQYDASITTTDILAALRFSQPSDIDDLSQYDNHAPTLLTSGVHAPCWAYLTLRDTAHPVFVAEVRSNGRAMCVNLVATDDDDDTRVLEFGEASLLLVPNAWLAPASGDWLPQPGRPA